MNPTNKQTPREIVEAGSPDNNVNSLLEYSILHSDNNLCHEHRTHTQDDKTKRTKRLKRKLISLK